MAWWGDIWVEKNHSETGEEFLLAGDGYRRQGLVQAVQSLLAGTWLGGVVSLYED